MLQAVLFDVDGTLAETEEFHRCAFNASFEAHGLQHRWSVGQYRELLKVTGGKERLRAYFSSVGQTPDDAQILSLHLAKNDLYGRNLLAGGAQLRPGVQRLLREAQEAGLALGIATTTSESNLDALLRPLMGPQWTQRFACVVAGDQVARKKPAPDVYLACLTQLHIPPDAAIAIEDSAVGIASAGAAGIAVLATPSLYTELNDFSAAASTVPDLGDPQMPWNHDVPGFARRWVQVADLRRLVASQSIVLGNEMAQR